MSRYARNETNEPLAWNFKVSKCVWYVKFLNAGTIRVCVGSTENFGMKGLVCQAYKVCLSETRSMGH